MGGHDGCVCRPLSSVVWFLFGMLIFEHILSNFASFKAFVSDLFALAFFVMYYCCRSRCFRLDFLLIMAAMEPSGFLSDGVTG